MCVAARLVSGWRGSVDLLVVVTFAPPFVVVVPGLPVLVGAVNVFVGSLGLLLPSW